MVFLLSAVTLLLCFSPSNTQTLEPSGKNICQDLRDPSRLVCCTGWRQAGKECTIPVCEGEQMCQSDELCVYPGVCRCPPGYYGAHCKTPCPPEFWAPDCREACHCHPHGRCHPVTGECTCLPNHWGPLCQYACNCTSHGRCHPVHGNCTCDEGWWTPICAKRCQCFARGSLGTTCDQQSGRCQCQTGHWGHKCSLSCSCFLSQCHQRTGVCDCQGGWWGPICDRRCNCDMRHSRCEPLDGRCVCQPGYQGGFCNEPCPAGKYGAGCKMSCGHCKDGLSCSATTGVCSGCELGWNGTRCDRPCPDGYYGDGCQEKCPRCRSGETCDPHTGTCWRCDPGLTGPGCEEVCPDRTYGDACHFLCSPCFHGNCHHVTGRCVCEPGFQGESCNSSCPAWQYGLNCSFVCDCGDSVTCHPVTGTCPYSWRGAVLAGVLVPVLLVLLAVLSCCVCCGGGSADGKDRVTVGDGGASARVKHRVYNVLANISAALPCISVWSSGLPRVTVSHHDPELNFNHSFIEPPSSGWLTEGSSFDSDEEEGEALYCVPPREDIPGLAGGEFHEMSSKCNMFLDPSGFSSDDMALPFAIPRTSSNAKAKRPSVSFAEGTRFSPKERRGSAQDPGTTPPGPPRIKPKSPWGVLMLSALQGGGARSAEVDDGGEAGVRGEQEEEVAEQGRGAGGDSPEAGSEGGDQEADRYISTPSRTTLQVPGAASRRRTLSNTAAHKGPQLPVSAASDAQAGEASGEKVTTVYVTVGKAGRPVSKVEPSSDGPVQAMLRRLGSIQRQKDQEAGRPKAKGAEAIAKPPRRKLGARASVWEEQGGASGGEVVMRKPSRRSKQTSLSASGSTGADNDTSSPPEGATPKRPLSSALRSVPEGASADSGLEVRAGSAWAGEDATMGQIDNGYQTVGPVASSLSEVIANKGAVSSADAEPSYENVLITHS